GWHVACTPCRSVKQRDRPMTKQTKARPRQNDDEFLAAHGKALSASSRRAKWIRSRDEREDHPGQTLATRERDVIEHWAQERGAQPPTTPAGDTDHPRVLRFDCPEYDDRLQEVSWDAGYRAFD